MPEPGPGSPSTEDRSDRRPAFSVGPGIHDALTDLHLYVLALDAERQRVEERMAALDLFGADSWTDAELARRHDTSEPNLARLVELGRRWAEIASQLEVLRATIDALRAQADPAGKHL